jgi:hypothetical protein
MATLLELVSDKWVCNVLVSVVRRYRGPCTHDYASHLITPRAHAQQGVM